MSDEFAQRVIQCIAKTQHIAAGNIQLDSTFEELKIDSLDGINILFALESEFSIAIPDDAARKVRTVRELAEGLEKLIESGGAAVPRAEPPGQ